MSRNTVISVRIPPDDSDRLNNAVASESRRLKMDCSKNMLIIRAIREMCERIERSTPDRKHY